MKGGIFFSAICVTLSLIGIICIIANLSFFDIELLLALFGGFMSIVFILCTFAEKSRYLIIDDTKIVLPRGANKNGRMVFKRTVIKLDDILFIESELHKGLFLISKDTIFYTITLHDGTKITFTLFAYGKDAEKEIIDTLKTEINRCRHIGNANQFPKYDAILKALTDSPAT